MRVRGALINYTAGSNQGGASRCFGYALRGSGVKSSVLKVLSSGSTFRPEFRSDACFCGANAAKQLTMHSATCPVRISRC